MGQSNQSNSGLKSTLKWVGGKRRLASEIVEFFPSQTRNYFEPFLGGASVFLTAQPAMANLSDMNNSLINYFVQLRDSPEPLMNGAKRIQDEFNSLEDGTARKSFFYRLRAEFNEQKAEPGLESAARFLFLNKTSFNGLYRENARGEFNVPFNNTEKLVLFEVDNIIENSKALANANLAASSFSEAVKKVGRDDLVYFDPPYVPLSQTAAFTAYTKAPFGPRAQEHLRDIAKDLVKKGATVILSNSFSPDVERLYKDFELHELKINRLVAASGSSRAQISEYLIVGRPSA